MPSMEGQTTICYMIQRDGRSFGSEPKQSDEPCVIEIDDPKNMWFQPVARPIMTLRYWTNCPAVTWIHTQPMTDEPWKGSGESFSEQAESSASFIKLTAPRTVISQSHSVDHCSMVGISGPNPSKIVDKRSEHFSSTSDPSRWNRSSLDSSYHEHLPETLSQKTRATVKQKISLQRGRRWWPHVRRTEESMLLEVFQEWLHTL